MAIVKQSFRSLVKHPGSSLVSVLAMALGIALVSSTFSYLNGIFFRGLPFENAEEIVYIKQYDPAKKRERWVFSNDQVRYLQESTTTLQELSGFNIKRSNLRVPGRVARFTEETVVSPNFLELLQVKPTLGRSFLPEDAEAGSAPVALLSDAIWEEEYEGSAHVLGESLLINGVATTVIGVLPEGFDFPHRSDLWTPVQADSNTALNLLGRLNPGKSHSQAQSDLSRIMEVLAASGPEDQRDYTAATVAPYTTTVIGTRFVQLSKVMMAAAVLVLLVACANTSNLVFARISLRMPELAIRAALGASQKRMFQLLIMESIALAMAGATLGILLTLGLIRVIESFEKSNLVPTWISYEMDWRFFIVMAMVTIAAGVLTGLVPALRASRNDVHSLLQDQHGGASSLKLGRLNRALVVFQIAVCCALLSAGWMLYTNVKNGTDSLSFNPESALTVRLELLDGDYPNDDEIRTFYKTLINAVRLEPDIDKAALTSRVGMGKSGSVNIDIKGREPTPDRSPSARLEVITPDFFAAMEAPLLRGRLFGEDELNVTIINNQMARHYWPNADPIGQQIRVDQVGYEWATIIGIAPDLKMDGFGTELLSEPDGGAGFYLPHHQYPRRGMSLILRGPVPVATLEQTLRRVMTQQDANLAYGVLTLKDAIESRISVFRVLMSVFAAFGIGGLFLAAIGIFGIVSFATNQRVREIGLRVALGAKRRDVLGFVLRQGLSQVVLGVALGLVFTGLVSGLLQQVLPGLENQSAFGYTALGFGLLVVTLIAALLPAGRALRVDPVTALRQD
ncbi:MAG: ABC transporter permease [Verrucomicrobiae bacterium]|nr:ABC transporter permease [Verrucomicrobiae bacterium]